MKNWLAGALAVMMIATAPSWSEAKRVGAGKSQGMQRSAPAQNTPQNTPPQQAAPQQPAAPQQTAPAAAPAAAGAAAAAAAPAKRSWLGPIAGLAAGLGLAALMSHLGLGEAFANFLMLALLGIAAVFLVLFLLRRFGPGARQQPALATSSAGSASPASPAWGHAAPAPASSAPAATSTTMARTGLEPASGELSVTGQPLPKLGGDPGAPVVQAPAQAAAVSSAPSLPEGFDLPAFERVAKMIFIRLQAANDAGDLEDLRRFTTPEMFSALRLDLQERGATTQRTDVERVDAQVIDFATETGRQIVSVRFHGLIREEADAPASAFDEVWHLVKGESDTSWAIAGIQQAH